MENTVQLLKQAEEEARKKDLFTLLQKHIHINSMLQME